MTSEERKEARYQRRLAKRIEKKKELNKKYGNFDEIISFDNLCDAFYKCKKTVSWKASTQKYERNLFKNVYQTRKDIYAGKSVSKGYDRRRNRKLAKYRQSNGQGRCLWYSK